MAKTTKTVKIRIDKIPGVLTDDVIVGVNGVNYQIPRGRTVEVPDFVYAEYERSMKAQEALLDKQASLRYKDPAEEAKKANSGAE